MTESTKNFNEDSSESESVMSDASTLRPLPEYGSDAYFPELCEQSSDEELENCIFDPIVDDGSKRHRHRNWFLTHFVEEWPIDFGKNSDRIAFAVLTKEIGEKTGKVHFHLYVEFNDAVDMSVVKTIFDCRAANCQVRKGTQKQAFAYCTKKRTRFPGFQPIIFGSPKIQGKRSDLDWIVEAISQGATKLELLRYGGGNVLRHINMINSAQKAFLGMDFVDNVLIAGRSKVSDVMSASPEDMSSFVASAKDHAQAKDNHLKFCRRQNPSKTLMTSLLSVRPGEKPIEPTSLEAVLEARNTASVKKEKKDKKKKDPLSLIKEYKRFSKADVENIVNRVSDALGLYLDQYEMISDAEVVYPTDAAVHMVHHAYGFIDEAVNKSIAPSVAPELVEGIQEKIIYASGARFDDMLFKVLEAKGYDPIEILDLEARMEKGLRDEQSNSDLDDEETPTEMGCPE